MPAADGDDARSTLSSAVIGQLIHHGMSRPDERSQKRTIETIDSIDHKPDPQAAKNQHAQKTRQEPQGGIRKNGQNSLTSKFSSVDVQEKNGKPNAKQGDATQHKEKPTFDPQAGGQPAPQLSNILSETFSLRFSQLIHTRSVAGRE